MLVFDLETDGLLSEATVIHTLCIHDTDTEEYVRYDLKAVPKGLKRLAEADSIVGHNILGFDLQVIKKLYPSFILKPQCDVKDTMVWGKVAFPDIKQSDFKLFASGRIPGSLIGTHKLKAYGYRLGILKGDYGEQEEAWKEWSPEMSEYCEQDVRVTVALLKKLLEKNVSPEALQIEHQVAEILVRQEARGVLFDVKAAQKLYATLIGRKDELLVELQKVMKPWYRPAQKKPWTPKQDSKRYGYVAGCPLTKIELVEFNPSSRAHIASRLKKLFGWEPVEFTQAGEPKLDDEIISALPYPEAKLIGEYLMISKRLGQLSDGDEAWLKAVDENSRIHGYVNSNGAGTGRMTHSKPNLAQVPKVGKPYGKECRSLFTVPEGYKLVGCDAASLELRCLSHYMAPWDGGAYGRAAVSGTKENGTDVHTINQKAIGADSRDDGKTWFYAFIYGAGNPKLGSILLNGKPGDAGKLGGKSKSRFKKKLPALGKLSDKVLERVKEKGYIVGIDGRIIKIRSEHSALNFLLQGCGAILMKKAWCILDDLLQAEGFKNYFQDSENYDYEFVLNVHDEAQLETKEPIAERVGQLAREAIVKAGEYFKFRCPLDGEYAIGDNWADTH